MATKTQSFSMRKEIATTLRLLSQANKEVVISDETKMPADYAKPQEEHNKLCWPYDFRSDRERKEVKDILDEVVKAVYQETPDYEQQDLATEQDVDLLKSKLNLLRTSIQPLHPLVAAISLGIDLDNCKAGKGFWEEAMQLLERIGTEHIERLEARDGMDDLAHMLGFELYTHLLNSDSSKNSGEVNISAVLDYEKWGG